MFTDVAPSIVGRQRLFPRPSAAGHVEFLEVVAFDEGDQEVGVLGVGGVPARLEALRPAFVVGRLQLKQACVPVPKQELAVVFVALLGVVVDAEALSLLVVVVVGALACPGGVALDAKVVVGPLGQLAHAVAALQDALRQGDARRDAVLLHLRHRLGLPSRDVMLLRGGRLGVAHSPNHVCTQHTCKGQKQGSEGKRRDLHGAADSNVQASLRLPRGALCRLELLPCAVWKTAVRARPRPPPESARLARRRSATSRPSPRLRRPLRWRFLRWGGT